VESEECPKCGTSLEANKCWRDVFADGELGRLEIFCPSRKEGCKWTGQRLLLEVRSIDTIKIEFTVSENLAFL
jgi:hypothetical protein